MESEFVSKITFFGTGTSQGVPMIGCNCDVCKSTDPRDNRLRSSALIDHIGFKILIDAGPDFRYQMLRSNTSYLDAILLTHEHKDHTGGLDDIRAFNYFTGKPFPIYCEERVFKSLKREFSYVFEENPYPGAPQFDIRVIDEHPFTVSGHNSGERVCEVIPVRALHYKLPVLGFRIGNIAYITDAVMIPESEFDKLKDLDILVINTVRREKHISHFSLDEAIDVIKRVDPKLGFLTHLSHQIGLHSTLERDLPKGIYAAYDGLSVSTTNPK